MSVLENMFLKFIRWLLWVIVMTQGIFLASRWIPCCSVAQELAVCWLSCSVACGILIPPPGIEPTSPALQGGCLLPGPPAKS